MLLRRATFVMLAVMACDVPQEVTGRTSLEGRLQGRVQGRVQGFVGSDYEGEWTLDVVAELIQTGLSRGCGLPTSVHPETLDCFPELWSFLHGDETRQRAYRYFVEAMADPGTDVATSIDDGATITGYHAGMAGLGPGFLAPEASPSEAEEAWVSSLVASWANYEFSMYVDSRGAHPNFDAYLAAATDEETNTVQEAVFSANFFTRQPTVVWLGPGPVLRSVVAGAEECVTAEILTRGCGPFADGVAPADCWLTIGGTTRRDCDEPGPPREALGPLFTFPAHYGACTWNPEGGSSGGGLPPPMDDPGSGEETRRYTVTTWMTLTDWDQIAADLPECITGGAPAGP